MFILVTIKNEKFGKLTTMTIRRNVLDHALNDTKIEKIYVGSPKLVNNNHP